MAHEASSSRWHGARAVPARLERLRAAARDRHGLLRSGAGSEDALRIRAEGEGESLRVRAKGQSQAQAQEIITKTLTPDYLKFKL